MNLDLSKSRWMDQEFKMGKREWRINHLPPLLAKDVLTDHIRPVFAAADGLDLRDENQLLVLFGRIPSVHLKAMSAIFAKESLRTKNDAGQWVPFASDPEQYAQGMTAVDLMMLDFRCIAVNFGESVFAFVRNMVELAGADPQQLRDALTPSSTSE